MGMLMAAKTDMVQNLDVYNAVYRPVVEVSISTKYVSFQDALRGERVDACCMYARVWYCSASCCPCLEKKRWASPHECPRASPTFLVSVVQLLFVNVVVNSQLARLSTLFWDILVGWCFLFFQPKTPRSWQKSPREGPLEFSSLSCSGQAHHGSAVVRCQSAGDDRAGVEFSSFPVTCIA